MLKNCLLALALCALTAVTGMAEGKHVPTPSTWSLNNKLSDFGGAPAPKSDIQIITKDTAKWLAFEETAVEADGKTTKYVWSGPVDGTVHPFTMPKGATFSWDDKTDKGILTDVDGAKVTNELVKVTEKQITFNLTIQAGTGPVIKQTLVYDRTK